MIGFVIISDVSTNTKQLRRNPTKKNVLRKLDMFVRRRWSTTNPMSTLQHQHLTSEQLPLLSQSSLPLHIPTPDHSLIPEMLPSHHEELVTLSGANQLIRYIHFNDIMFDI